MTANEYAVRTDKFRQRLIDLHRDDVQWATVLDRHGFLLVRVCTAEGREVEVPLDIALAQLDAARRRLDTTKAVESSLATLDELDPSESGAPPKDAPGVIHRAHELRRKPLDTLTVEELRTLITAEVGLPHVVPLAIRHLQDNPLAEGAYYAGDLLEALLRVDAQYWREHSEHWYGVSDAIHTLRDALARLDDDDLVTRFLAIYETRAS